MPIKAELTFLVMTSSPSLGVARGWNLKPGAVGHRGDVGDLEACRTWMILCLARDGDLATRCRYEVIREAAFFSKLGLLREGPQKVGSRNASWMSMTRRTVLGCFDILMEGFLGNDLGLVGRIERGLTPRGDAMEDRFFYKKKLYDDKAG